MSESCFKSFARRLSIATTLLFASPLFAETTDPAAYEYFENRIRPLLAERCFECHGTEKQKSGLRLDTREAILLGGEMGPAAVAGNPAESLLLDAVEYRGDLEMPPKEKLKDDEIALLRQWVEMGMPWDPHAPPPKSKAEKTWEAHWAFQPIRDVSPPPIATPDRVQTPIDQFVLARLEEAGHTLSPQADRETLIRRAYYDLIGLPPSYEEVKAFVENPSSSAFTRVVDDLLSRKEYGQRWGRHWLDVARYADSKGPIDGGEQRYAFAHTYRDYVINALNNDLSYDRFVLEQVAADQLDIEDYDPAQAAMGFLTLGNKYYERVDEMVDDRIDVVGRGLMGLTMGCARCHTHKFDPIPTGDYYSWYGVFRSSTEPYYFDKPLLEKPIETKSRAWRDYIQDYHKKGSALKAYRQQQLKDITHEMRAYAADYLEYVAEEHPEHRSVAQFARRTDRTLIRGPSLHSEGGPFHWREFVYSRSEDDPVFGIWLRLAALSKEELPSRFEEVLSDFPQIHPTIREALLNHPPKKLAHVARAIGGVLEATYADWRKLLAKNYKAKKFEGPRKEELRQALYGQASPCVMTVEESRDFYRILEHDTIRMFQGAFEKVFFDHAAVAPERALVMADQPKLYNPYVFVRGNPKNKGPEVPRHFLKMMSTIDDGQPFQQGSGRLELAKAIVHPDNPLTARVMVNRIWGWHFGKELVRTPSDFGTRSLAPTHPDLLDYLATQFRRGGWSIKNLHRLIMHSATYQQASDANPELLEEDPENKLLWRANPQRLDFESFRDYLLQVSGNLDTSLGGISTSDLFSTRRSTYLSISRNRLSSVYSMFDFPDPSLSTPKRVTTITPQQALFLMNSPFLLEVSENLVDGVHAENPRPEQEERINLFYRQIYRRDASDDELQLATAYLDVERDSQDTGIAPEAPTEEHWFYGSGHYDVEKKRVTSFEPLPHFTGRAYQGAEEWPNEKYGPLRLTRNGGYPGKGATGAAIRRLVIPDDGTLRITGELRHSGSCDEGINARIVSNQSGGIGRWRIANAEVSTSFRRIKAKAGETIDFVVSCDAPGNCDAFEWAPVVSFTPEKETKGSGRVKFSAPEDFAGPNGTMPPLTPWVKLAHAMLQSNEFIFVN
jgi:hypothetical protein